MPSRRDRAKADATRTPLADLAPAVPQRAPNAATPEPDDDMLPESSATMPAEAPETDTAPANVRSRPGARKVGSRSSAPAVPRTIAEMQATSHHTVAVETDALEREERAEEEPEPSPLFVPLQTLILMTLVPFAILAVPQPLIDLIWLGAGLSKGVIAVVNLIVLCVSGLVALMLLFRNWRIAFHDVPSELRPSSVLELWERRTSGERRNGWITGGLVCVGGFVLLTVLFLVLTVTSQRLAAIYLVPYLLVTQFVKAVGAVLFLGLLQRGLFALQSPTKATVITALLYGVSLAIWNALTLTATLGFKQQTIGAATQAATTQPTSVATFIIYFTFVSFAVAFAAAWFRLRSGSLIAAVCFQLLLLLLGISV